MPYLLRTLSLIITAVQLVTSAYICWFWHRQVHMLGLPAFPNTTDSAADVHKLEYNSDKDLSYPGNIKQSVLASQNLTIFRPQPEGISNRPRASAFHTIQHLDATNTWRPAFLQELEVLMAAGGTQEGLMPTSFVTLTRTRTTTVTFFSSGPVARSTSEPSISERVLQKTTKLELKK